MKGFFDIILSVVKNIDVSSILSAFIGGWIAWHAALKAVDRTYVREREKRVKEEAENLEVFLSSIYAEINTLWERYMWGVGTDIEKLKDGEPFLFFYPLTQNYFTIYDSHSLLVGSIKDKKMRDLIILTYVQAKGLIDSYRFNNELVREYKNYLIASQQPNGASWKLQQEQELDGLREYAVTLKEQHQAIKNNVAKLLTCLRQPDAVQGERLTKGGKTMQKSALMVSGIIFLVVALLHVWRYLMKVPVTFGATQIPLALSFAGAVAGFLLALWMFSAAGKS